MSGYNQAPGNPGDLPSHELSRRHNTLARQFFYDVFNLDSDDLPNELPDPDRAFETISIALSYMEQHARTTLRPADADNLPRYRGSVDAAIRRIQALQHIYVDGGELKDLKGADDRPISRTARAILIESARHAVRALLRGQPGPGWMDGRYVDALRALATECLPGDLTINEAATLEERSTMREFSYDIRDVPVNMLPLSPPTKFHLKLARFHVLGNAMGDPAIIRGIGPDNELLFVVGQLIEPDSLPDYLPISRTWLGDV